MATAPSFTDNLLPTNNGGFKILIVSYTLVFAAALVVVIRAIVRYRVSRAAEGSDFLLPIALTVAFAQTVCVHFGVNYGMGQHIEDLSRENFAQYQKAVYANSILYLLVLGISKASIALLIKNVEPQKPVLVSCYLVLAIVCTWTICSVAGVGIQCALPRPWEVREGRCINLAIFYNALAAINMLTDLAVVIIPISMICRLRIERQKKFWVCSLFSTRLVVSVFTGIQLFHLQVTLVGRDITYTIVPLQLWTQVVLNTSIITACIPSLGKVVIDLVQGLKVRRPSSNDIEMTLSPNSQKKDSIVSLQEIEVVTTPKTSKPSKLRGLFGKKHASVQAKTVSLNSSPRHSDSQNTQAASSSSTETTTQIVETTKLNEDLSTTLYVVEKQRIMPSSPAEPTSKATPSRRATDDVPPQWPLRDERLEDGWRACLVNNHSHKHMEMSAEDEEAWARMA